MLIDGDETFKNKKNNLSSVGMVGTLCFEAVDRQDSFTELKQSVLERKSSINHCTH